MYADLPFPRGSTFFNGDSNRVTSANVTGLIGRIFKCNDGNVAVNDTTNGHGTQQQMLLRVCRNSSGGNLTRVKGVKFATRSAAYGGVVAGHVDTVSIYGEIIDDYYRATQNIINNDLFYTVVQGPVKTKMATHAVTITALDPAAATTLSFDAVGHLVDSVAGAISIGKAHEYVRATATGQFRRVFVGTMFAAKQ